MTPVFLLVGLAGFLVALGLCGRIRRLAISHALLDVPNARSLHTKPVPRLGGVAIVVAVVAATGVQFATGQGSGRVLVWVGLALPVAVLGLVDDLRPLGAPMRLLLQIGAATAFVHLAGVPARVLVLTGVPVVPPAWLTTTLGVVWICGVLNIYNFMDGMDGLAGTQALFASASLAVACGLRGALDLSLVLVALSAASLGFLLHNAPPARIFMGDGGSTFIGFTLAALPILAMKEGVEVPVLAGPLALSPFLLDGTFTIARRALRKERVWEAHRTHLYQRAVAAGLDHRDVLIPYAAWIATGAAFAGAIPLVTAPTGACLVAVVLAQLGLCWAWVRGLERAAPRPR